jgi:hypothetical protein
MQEMRREQTLDSTFKRLMLLTEKSGMYDLNEVGVLVRKSPYDSTGQFVVPQSLVSRILYLEHYPPAAGHPRGHRMFQTIRKSFFWPHIAEDVYDTVRQCDLCTRNRISEKAENESSQALPANGPLESVAMDILGPLPRTKMGIVSS